MPDPGSGISVPSPTNPNDADDSAANAGPGSAGLDGGGSVVVVIPTYNERDNLESLVTRLLGLDPGYRVLVVDDGSPDGTGDVADTLEAGSPGRVGVLHRPAKAGIGPAYVAGFRVALATGAPLVAQMDADLSHDPAALATLVAGATTHDLVLGSRYVAGGKTVGWPPRRLLLSRFGGWYARVALGFPVHDPTGGFKVFRREALAALPLDDLRTDGYSFQIETTWRVWRGGGRVLEVPITFTDRVAGASKLSRGIMVEAALVVWRLRWDGMRSRRA